LAGWPLNGAGVVLSLLFIRARIRRRPPPQRGLLYRALPPIGPGGKRPGGPRPAGGFSPIVTIGSLSRSLLTQTPPGGCDAPAGNDRQAQGDYPQAGVGVKCHRL
jgi:hypothetical protein